MREVNRPQVGPERRDPVVDQRRVVAGDRAAPTPQDVGGGGPAVQRERVVLGVGEVIPPSGGPPQVAGPDEAAQHVLGYTLASGVGGGE